MQKWLIYSLSTLVALGIGLLLLGPVGPVPGLFIGGRAATPPANWTDTTLPDEVLLRTTGGLLPRVVTIWVVESGNDLNIFGAAGSGWVESVLRDPNVQLRIEDETFDLIATRLDLSDAAVYAKYIERYKPDYPDLVASMPAPSDFAAVQDAGVGFRLTRR